MHHRHPFHIVDMSPWPLAGSTGALFMAAGFGMWMHKFDPSLMLGKIGLMIVLFTMTQWWRDVSREASFQGKHTERVEKGLRMGMIFFISSEIMLFFSFFWAFFHSSLSPGVSAGAWPPEGVMSINPLEVPLLNTTLLLSSGATITWAHMSIINSDKGEANLGFASTVSLGFSFTMLQVLEYMYCSFTVSDSVYGSTFFIGTGFHGLHVIVGTIFIMVMWSRHVLDHFTNRHHFGFEASAWYWHFVDVVWLFLYLCFYWWGY